MGSREVYTWPEGVAAFTTGGAGAGWVTGNYMRDVRVRIERVTHSFRPPHSVVWVHRNTQNNMHVAVSQVHSDGYLRAFADQDVNPDSATHAHFQYTNPETNATAGFYGWSGKLTNVSFFDSEGKPGGAMTMEGWFPVWSSYGAL